MTAVEWLIDNLNTLKTEPMQDLLLVDAINKAKEMERKQMIEFAKLHVEAALKEASESRCIEMLNKTWYAYSLEPGTKVLERINITVNKNSILNSYPLTNIK